MYLSLTFAGIGQKLYGYIQRKMHALS